MNEYLPLALRRHREAQHTSDRNNKNGQQIDIHRFSSSPLSLFLSPLLSSATSQEKENKLHCNKFSFSIKGTRPSSTRPVRPLGRVRTHRGLEPGGWAYSGSWVALTRKIRRPSLLNTAVATPRRRRGGGGTLMVGGGRPQPRRCCTARCRMGRWRG